MSITWGATEISDYLRSIGIESDRADDIETYVKDMTSAHPNISRDSSLIDVLAAKTRDILFIADETYPINMHGSEPEMVAWILANRPDLAELATAYTNIVYWDVWDIARWAEGIPPDATVANDQVGYYQTVKERDLERARLNLTRIVYYLRHFTGLDHPTLPGQSELVWSE